MGKTSTSGASGHQKYRSRRRQQPGAAAVEHPLARWPGEPAAHVQAHVGVSADGDPFQHQKQRAQHHELRRNGVGRVDELRQERGENQDGLGVTN